MDKRQLLKAHAETLFRPSGNDERGGFMILGDWVVYVRWDDVAIATGLSISEIWPLVSRVYQANTQSSLSVA